MTSEVILYLVKNLRLYNVSIHIYFYQNRFINECARKKNGKNPVVKGFRSFFVRHKSTYVFDKCLSSGRE